MDLILRKKIEMKLISIYVKAHNGGFVCPTPVVLIEEHLMAHFRSRFIHL